MNNSPFNLDPETIKFAKDDSSPTTDMVVNKPLDKIVSCFEPDRKEELKVLRELISTLANLNSGSHFMEKLEQCMNDAKKLDCHDLRVNRPSFMEYLTAKAHGE